MSMATMVQDKQRQFTYLTQCLQTFLTECGRTQAVLAPTVLQSDQEEYLVSLLKTTARTIGSNITVRQSPAVQLTITRKHREISQDTLQSSEDTHCTIEEQLQAQHHQHQSPNHAMGDKTRCLFAQ